MTTIIYKGMEVGKLPDLQNYVLKEHIGDLAYMDTVPDSMIAASSSISVIKQAIDDIRRSIEGEADRTYSLDYVKNQDEGKWYMTLSDGTTVQKLEVPEEWYKGGAGSLADQYALGDVPATLGVKQTIKLYNTQSDTYQDYPYPHYEASIHDDVFADITSLLAINNFDTGTGLPYLTCKKPVLDLQIGAYADVSGTFARDVSGDENVVTDEYIPEYFETAEVNAAILFSDGSAITVPPFHILRFKGAGRGLYGLKSIGKAYIDTGLPMDGTCELEVTGYLAEVNTSTLMGAFVSTSNRTTLRLLPGSNKIQSMWSANQEIAGHGIDLMAEFTYRQKANKVVFTQGDHVYPYTDTSHTTSQSGGANILLMQEKAGGSYGSVVLCDAVYRNQSGYVLHHYEPFTIPDGAGGMVNVFVDTHELTKQGELDIKINGLASTYAAGRVYQAATGSLEEVTA